jgi:hypothetical protein
MARDCRYAKFDMTPCVLRDGAICFALGNNDEPICVGCERTPAQLDVPRPPDWEQIVQHVRDEDRRRDKRRRK